MSRQRDTPSRSSNAIMPAIGAAGVDLCLEPLARSDTNFLNTCAQAMEVIRQVDHPISSCTWTSRPRAANGTRPFPS